MGEGGDASLLPVVQETGGDASLLPVVQETGGGHGVTVLNPAVGPGNAQRGEDGQRYIHVESTVEL